MGETMKISQLLPTLLALFPSAALSEPVLSTAIPMDKTEAVKKVAGALCSPEQESDKSYVVKVAGDSFYCDEESTRLIANTAMASLEEGVARSRRWKQLAVEGGEDEDWGKMVDKAKDIGKGAYDWAKDAADVVVDWIDSSED